jgi:transposase
VFFSSLTFARDLSCAKTVSMNTTPPDHLARPRFQRAERSQVKMQCFALDQMLRADHSARSIWQFVESLDLSPLYAEIKAVKGHVGRPPADPKIPMALWLLATTEGIGSARKLAELCTRDLAYMWICGDVGVNHHLLSDFRTEHVEFLDQLLTDSVATLLHQDLITLETVSQDGMRVRAHAGSSSFRRRKTLKTCLQEARKQIDTLREENEADSSGCDRRTTAAQKRVARERKERVEKALDELVEVEGKMERRKKGSSETARASTTDPEARRMKMACGGFRPAYNVEFATTNNTRVIVGAYVTNSGSDGGQMSPMIEQIEARFGQRPREYLVDGGFSTLDDIERVEKGGSKVYAPIKDEEKKRLHGQDPFSRRKRDSDEIANWRKRMGTQEARAKYSERASTAEYPNAVCRNRGLQQFLLRGLRKVRAVTLWYALAYNFTRMQALCAPNAET